MIALTDSNETTTFTQLGGLHFQGPNHGVLPVGPNGIVAFGNLDPGPEENYLTAITYNYTLSLQGLAAGVDCQYTDAPSPVLVGQVDNYTLAYEGDCPQGQTVPGLSVYPAPLGLVGNLGAWACKTSGESYTLYLRGDGNYVNVVGNMTCNISPVQRAVYNVLYDARSNLFIAQDQGPAISINTSQPTDDAIFSLVDTIAETQGLTMNLVAESVITYGVKNFGIPLTNASIYSQNDTYLRLYEAMIQGILQYEVCDCVSPLFAQFMDLF
jgi:hypothetical protein